LSNTKKCPTWGHLSLVHMSDPNLFFLWKGPSQAERRNRMREENLHVLLFPFLI
jgi:hypothetical protein